MLKVTRRAVLATALLIAAASVVAPDAVLAQGQPAAPATTQPAPAAAPSAAPSDTTAPVASTGNRSTELVENPYGLEALWKGGDMVARITLGILVIMSMGSWYVIITKVYEQAKLRRQARAANESFWNAATVQDGTAKLKDGSPFRFIAETGIEASQKHTGLLGNVDLNTWISMSIQRAIDNVQSLPRHRRLDGALRGPVRHGVGHLSRADRDRHRGPGLDRQGRGSGGRGVDHDRHRPRRRGARGAGL